MEASGRSEVQVRFYQDNPHDAKRAFDVFAGIFARTGQGTALIQEDVVIKNQVIGVTSFYKQTSYKQDP